ncbi:MAG: SusC/RagA family TonB-linked outer membrane protein [Chitinophagaceae bacterium]|nr:SusC/RagA family TonB-linked outer membrane protein [Chitinophagaceae bacterium]
MKLTVILLLVSCLHVSATGYSQRVTLKVMNTPLIKVLSSIEEQTGYIFFCDVELLKKAKGVTVNLKNVLLKNALDQCFALQPLTYSMEDKVISVHLRTLSTSVSTLEKVMLLAQITGTITSAAGEVLQGVNVIVKSTGTGTVTDNKGFFSIQADKTDVLIVSSIGFATRELSVGNQTLINIILSPADQQLNEVVVTALGISRSSKGITYATQKVGGDELTSVKDANLINSLSGKVAGLTINRSASGTGGSVKVVMRGNKSTQNNSPLYVIDGIPMINTPVGQPENVFGQSSGTSSPGRDGGDAISNLNPEDIESIQVLKGASAAALYGSQAANGALVITTKKGKAGAAQITVSSNFTIDRVALKPELQYNYGQSSPAEEDGWGPAVNGGDLLKEFYQTGTTWINSVSLSAGTDRAQTYFSYANTSNKGVVPTSKFGRHTLTLRETAKFFDNRLSIDGFVTLTRQESDNRPVSGLYSNPQMSVALLPRNYGLAEYKNSYQYFSPSRRIELQDWWNINYDEGLIGNEYSQNPYWLLNRNTRTDARNRAFSSLTLKYDLNPSLAVQARGSYDYYTDEYQSQMSASTHPVMSDFNGRLILEDSKNKIAYGDVLLLFNKRVGGNFSLNGSLGAAINDITQNDKLLLDSYGAKADANGEKLGLQYANVFNAQSILPIGANKQQSVTKYQTQSILGSASVGFRDLLFADLTARNDWSSTLSFTPNADRGFFYFSAGVTAVLNEILRLPASVNLAKIRVSYAKVGNSVRAFATNPALYTYDPASVQYIKNVKGSFPGKPLKPEDNRSFELGTEWRFLDNRIGLDITYYRNNNYDQYFETPAPSGSELSTYYLNVGNIRNNGIEVIVNAVPVKSRNFEWSTSVNFAQNKNKVVSLSEAGVISGNPEFELTRTDNTYGSIVREGGSFGDILSYVVERDPKTGQMILDKGIPVRATDREVVGNPNPDFSAGWNNDFRYKSFNLGFLIDGRFGGEVLSLTQAILDAQGFSKASADARDNGGVRVSGIDKTTGAPYSGTTDAKEYYRGVGGRSAVGEFYIYDATAIRLRELTAGYIIPVKIKGIRQMAISLVGRNLFFIKREAPFDPEVSMSTSDGVQGVDAFGLPLTRSIGVNLKLGF